MNTVQFADALLAHYAATQPASMKAFDGHVPTNPANAYAVLTMTGSVPQRRALAHNILSDLQEFQWMVVNNSASGVRFNLMQLRAAFDGLRIDDRIVTYESASAPIYDDRVEGALRWSQTAVFSYYPKGSHD